MKIEVRSTTDLCCNMNLQKGTVVSPQFNFEKVEFEVEMEKEN